MVKCKDCPDKKELDAVEQVVNGAPEWACTQKHTECEDVVCLLRMIIWMLVDREEED